jgi:hypothetical protein
MGLIRPHQLYRESPNTRVDNNQHLSLTIIIDFFLFGHYLAHIVQHNVEKQEPTLPERSSKKRTRSLNIVSI